MTAQSEKIVPEITEEQDVPFNLEDMPDFSEKKDIITTKDAPNLDLMKFGLGSNMLGWCLFLMMICVLISLWKPDSTLVNNAFEAFKLIVMTILGYIFGTNKKD